MALSDTAHTYLLPPGLSLTVAAFCPQNESNGTVAELMGSGLDLVHLDEALDGCYLSDGSKADTYIPPYN